MFVAPLLLLVACSKDPLPTASLPATTTVGSAAAPTTAASEPSAVDVNGLKAAMDKGPITLVDVRTPEEYALGHVPGAVNIPIDELDGRVSELDSYRKQDLYLICAVGGRSARATAILAGEGFERPINVSGGTNGWQAAGLPLQ